MYLRNSALLSCMLAMALGSVASHAQSGGPMATPTAAINTTAPALLLHSRTELPGYTGDYGHFGVDVKASVFFSLPRLMAR